MEEEEDGCGMAPATCRVREARRDCMLSTPPPGNPEEDAAPAAPEAIAPVAVISDIGDMTSLRLPPACAPPGRRKNSSLERRESNPPPPPTPPPSSKELLWVSIESRLAKLQKRAFCHWVYFGKSDSDCYLIGCSAVTVQYKSYCTTTAITFVLY